MVKTTSKWPRVISQNAGRAIDRTQAIHSQPERALPLKSARVQHKKPRQLQAFQTQA